MSVHFGGCGAENKWNVKAFQVLPVHFGFRCATDAWSARE